ncbi:type II secretion system protein [Campylobacter curvus]|uniref:type II secretion system protein n=1 Tax=Campylobacter curvus TaxID=200 RepID=UPI00147064A0|nr:type II secretion system protein [Campylobacter curvus]
MKKGFTMIELIFVIVILGILAAVAIPRLAATRDDAEITKSISNTTLAVRDIMSYYTARGAFNEVAANMTNVGLVTSAGADIAKDASKEDVASSHAAIVAFVPFKKVACISLSLDPKEAAITVTEATGLSGADAVSCKAIADAPGVKALIDSRFANSSGTQTPGFKVGGSSNIKF